MKTTPTASFAATLAATVLLAASSFASAQTSASSEAKPAKASVKPAAKAGKKKPVHAKSVPAGVEAAEAARTPDELAIAERVHVGKLPCELGASVTLTQDEKSAGYFDVHGKNFKYRMFPVATTTGAIRLEDQKAGAVWLQLANKSMLMNQKQGIRLADECMSPAQVAVAETMKANPAASVLDAPKPAAGSDAAASKAAPAK